MRPSRRSFVQSAAAVSALAPSLALATEAAPGLVRPLKILILGGTGFTGPQQVRYALSRGHQVTLFNRGRQPHEWPGAVEELIWDRNAGDLKALAAAPGQPGWSVAAIYYHISVDPSAKPLLTST